MPLVPLSSAWLPSGRSLLLVGLAAVGNGGDAGFGLTPSFLLIGLAVVLVVVIAVVDDVGIILIVGCPFGGRSLAFEL